MRQRTNERTETNKYTLGWLKFMFTHHKYLMLVMRMYFIIHYFECIGMEIKIGGGDIGKGGGRS